MCAVASSQAPTIALCRSPAASRTSSVLSHRCRALAHDAGHLHILRLHGANACELHHRQRRLSCPHGIRRPRAAKQPAAEYRCTPAASVARRSSLPACRRVPAPECIPAVPSDATGSGENRPRTVQRKSADDNEIPRKQTVAEAYLLASTWQIRDLSVVSAMDSARSRPARWALGHAAFGSDG
jgi:hypothetical protein